MRLLLRSLWNRLRPKAQRDAEAGEKYIQEAEREVHGTLRVLGLRKQLLTYELDHRKGAKSGNNPNDKRT